MYDLFSSLSMYTPAIVHPHSLRPSPRHLVTSIYNNKDTVMTNGRRQQSQLAKAERPRIECVLDPAAGDVRGPRESVTTRSVSPPPHPRARVRVDSWLTQCSRNDSSRSSVGDDADSWAFPRGWPVLRRPRKLAH